jgi:hypothetical protein
MNIGLQQITSTANAMPVATDLIERFGDDQKQQGIESARSLGDRFGHIKSTREVPPLDRPAVRIDLNHVLEQLKAVSEAKGISDDEKKQAKSITTT